MFEGTSTMINFGLSAALMGVGATLVMDIWALLLKVLFQVPSLNYAFVGRWLGHIRQGILFHEGIFKSKEIAYEVWIGWVAHYLIGIMLAAGWLLIVGDSWLEHPRFLPAILFGMMTVIFPFAIMQPCFGMGFAASKLPHPTAARLKSLVAHLSFGVGLFITAFVDRVLIGDF